MCSAEVNGYHHHPAAFTVGEVFKTISLLVTLYCILQSSLVEIYWLKFKYIINLVYGWLIQGPFLLVTVFSCTCSEVLNVESRISVLI